LDIGFKERKVWNVFNFKSLYIKYQFTCVYWKAVSLRCKQITFIICYNQSAISRIDTYRFFPVKIYMYMYLWLPVRDSRGRDRMVVGFTTTSEILTSIITVTLCILYQIIFYSKSTLYIISILMEIKILNKEKHFKNNVL
jgi:hypothetical protein